ncbi:unnamed protein product [Rotaria magnacalcarata]|uniref:Uncharacterized protein n=1 Tax=Rotaria magnacalcarata TaxID=392030 RepID=A0A816SIK3_9BILA|nr:unnamed protein product [Rotaria magnacalcarata]CAF3970576.1 unnamed protein product [Rotaria magnacalcarata]
MALDCVNNNSIVVEYSSDEEHSNGEHEQYKNETPSQPDPANVVTLTENVINKSKAASESLHKPVRSSHRAQESRLKFKETPNKPIEYNHGPRSVAVGDFNSDTWLDMVVANHIVNTIAIYFEQKRAFFSNPIQYPTGNGSTPYMVAIGDFNMDNLLDIAVAKSKKKEICHWQASFPLRDKLH